MCGAPDVWRAGTAYEAELHRGWDLLPHDDNDMVSTKDLVQHIMQVSTPNNRTTFDSDDKPKADMSEDIKFEHMLRELTNASAQGASVSGDPGSPFFPPPPLITLACVLCLLEWQSPLEWQWACGTCFISVSGRVAPEGGARTLVR